MAEHHLHVYVMVELLAELLVLWIKTLQKYMIPMIYLTADALIFRNLPYVLGNFRWKVS